MRANENERKKALRVVKTAFAVALMVGVSGCASHRETFDCAPGAGVGCKSISQVNDMVDQTSPQRSLSQSGLSQTDSSGTDESEKSGNQTPLSTFMNTGVSDTDVSTNSAPLDLVSEVLVSETLVSPSGEAHARAAPAGVLKVWVAPFTDPEGNFHESALIHIPQTSLPQGDQPPRGLSYSGDSR